jgi:hypothetical protein
MSKYAQGSKRKAMRKAARPTRKDGQQGTHWVAPSERENEAGQRRVRRDRERFAQGIIDGGGE